MKIVSLLAIFFMALGARLSLAGAEEFYHVAPTDPLSPEEEREKLRAPAGFEVELVAAEPDIRKPMNFAFDARGRIWATQSVEYPFPNMDEKTARDCVKILEDTDGDGRADKSTVFADHLNIPIGIIPIAGGAIVFSIPKIYKLIDRDGDDRADRKEELYGTVGRADTHGLVNSFTWGFDGWIYACHGFANTSELKGADGASIKLNSGNTFRFLADGSHVEYHTRGQVNPFGLCFDPLGNLYSADCHSWPVYQLLRGAWYPSFGKPHDGLGFGPEMTRDDHGSTALCGMIYYDADQYPPEYRGTVFVGNVWTNRVNHDRLERHGSTYLAVRQPDFVRSEDPWFRPVYMQLGPDGAIYIGDFYNRIIGHYEVPLTHPGRDHDRGRIWRVVYKGSGETRPAKPPRADWSKAAIEGLLADLAHPNLAVRTQAANQVVLRVGAAAAEPLRGAFKASTSAFQRAHALWCLARLKALDEEILQLAAADASGLVRTHARLVLAEKREWSRGDQAAALQGLEDPDAFVQRAAAMALAAHPRPERLGPLLELRRKVPADDTHLLHAARIALRNQLALPESWAWLLGAARPEADAGLVADIALGVPAREAAAYLLSYLRGRQLAPTAEQVRHLARNAAPADFPLLLEFLRGAAAADDSRQAAHLIVFQRALEERGEALGAEAQAWAAALSEKLLADGDAGKAAPGIQLARAARLEAALPRLRSLALLETAAPELRRQASEALASLRPEESIPLLGQLLAGGEEPAQVREQAAQLLGSIQSPKAIEALGVNLRAAPSALAARIAEGLANSKEGGERLLSEIAGGKASARLLQSPAVSRRLERQEIDQEKIARLTAGLPEPSQEIQEAIERFKRQFAAARPDLEAGAKVFEKNCSACHRLAEKGGKVGPDLNGIGSRGLERLLEDLLDPNRNVDQAFRASIVVLKNGLAQTGLVQGEEGEVILLADAQGKPLQIPKKDIRARELSSLSPMPSNLLEIIPAAELPHLLAFLLAQRQMEPEPAPAK
ncbi:MAG: HEAT repeat domain-containing protein [Planctomycetes bacterium]|nr:HEAT repeat domain-containing protein [Planctomycetota bacterium]